MQASTNRCQLLLLLLLTTLTGCSSLVDGSGIVYAPPSMDFSAETLVTRLESPEAPGAGHFSIQIENAKFSQTPVTDIRATPHQPVIGDQIESEHTLVRGDWGSWEPVSLFAALGHSARRVGARWQAFGSNRHNAHKGDVSFSIAIAYENVSGERNDYYDDSDYFSINCFLFGSCDNEDDKNLAKAAYRTESADTDVMVGYRPAEKLLVHIGYFLKDVHYRSKVTYRDWNLDTEQVVGRTQSIRAENGWLRGPFVGITYDINSKVSVLAEYLHYEQSLFNDSKMNRQYSYNGTVRFNF